MIDPKLGDRVVAKGGPDSPLLRGYVGTVHRLYDRPHSVSYCTVRFDKYHECMWANSGSGENLRDIYFDDLDPAAISPFEEQVRAYINQELHSA